MRRLSPADLHVDLLFLVLLTAFALSRRKVSDVLCRVASPNLLASLSRSELVHSSRPSADVLLESVAASRDNISGLPQIEARGLVTFDNYSLVRIRR